MKKLLFIMSLFLLLSACELPDQTPPRGPTPTTQPPVTTPPRTQGRAVVDKVEVNVRESLPVQVSVVASGNVNESCISIDNPDIKYANKVFTVTLTTSRPAGACAQVITPYSKQFTLDVNNLTAGTYTVDVNGVKATFILKKDNTAPKTN